MEVLIKDAKFIITQDEDRRVLRDKDILIKEGLIEKVGKISGPVDEVIEARHHLVMPGLMNTHTHIPMGLFRGVADDMELFSWLTNKIWPMESNLTPYHIRAGTALGILEALKTGTTTFFDMYFFEDVIAEVALEMGIRGALAQAVVDFETMEGEDTLKIADRFVDRWKDKVREGILPCYGPHALYTVSEDRLSEVVERAREKEVPVQIHLSETKKEVEDVFKRFGKAPVQVIDELGLLDLNIVLAHGVWISNEEMPLLSKLNIMVSHNPLSNLKLASGIAPVPEMIKQGLNVSLGTDGSASNNTLDMFETIKVTALLHKVAKMDPTVMKAQEVLDMATRVPGRFLPWKLGVISEGYEADLLVLDVRKPWWVPTHSPISNLVYSVRSTDVRYVIVKGNILVKEGSYTLKDEETIYREAEKAALDLLDKSGVDSMLKSGE